MEKVLFTTLDDLKIQNWVVKKHTELNENFADWVIETGASLLEKREMPELIASRILKRRHPDLQEQVFFYIFGHAYFLDFFIPKKMLAVEIDGKQHKKTRVYDYRRDTLFRKLGIKTIRVSAKKVLKGDFPTWI